MVGTLTYVMGALMQLVFFFFYLLILQVRTTEGLAFGHQSRIFYSSCGLPACC